MRVQTCRGLLQCSLLPSSQLLYGKLTFNQFEGLYQLSRSSAKKCLASLIDQLRRSLEELLNENIAHMDVHLANICITRSFTVKLIDLDRCEPADNEVRACFVYQYSDMYTPGDKWKNCQLDWKAVGLMICFILDDQVQLKDYHHMISQDKVTKMLRLNDFVKYLLEEGQWNNAHYEAFCSEWLSECNSDIGTAML